MDGLSAEMEAHQPDAVFLEPQLAGGVDPLIKRMRASGVEARILMIVDSASDDEIARLKRMGIACIVGMRKEPKTYTACLWTVLSGDICCAPDPARLPAPSSIKNLSRRESQIAQLVAEGKRNQEIADITSTKVGTIKVQVSRIFKKLNVSSRVELILAIQKTVG
jgi:DNA-binding NarL/FixJ family response regulator